MEANEKVARKIVREIIDDLSDRRGLKWEWHRIDSDIQADIRNEWTDIVLKHIGGSTNAE